MLGPPKPRRLDAPIAVSLEELVPTDHVYRHLDRTLDLAFVRDLVKDAYAEVGRPSIDPVVFFKLQLVMFFEVVRSERQLMRVVADRLSLRWYLGYALDEPLPDHSSLTRIRDRYGLAIFRRFFEAVVERCRAAGLVWGEELSFDATKVGANAALASTRPRFAVEAHLARLFAGPEPAPPGDGEAPAGPVPLPVELSEEARAELAAAAAERHDWFGQAGHPGRGAARPRYRRLADFHASPPDPDATPMQRRGGGPCLGYHAHYAVDGGKARIVLALPVTPAAVMENTPMRDLLWRACFRWKLRPRQVTGDTADGTLENIVAVEDAGIRAYVPLPSGPHPQGIFRQSDFAYDPAADPYRCPAGQTLAFRGLKPGERVRVYQADAAACAACHLRPRCATGRSSRRIHRSFAEASLERVRADHATEAYRKAMRKRAVWVEPLFAAAKAWHGLGRFRLRGLEKVNGEALLVAAGQNLMGLLRRGGWGRRPGPGGAAGLAPPAPAPVPTALG
jgi:transposase